MAMTVRVTHPDVAKALRAMIDAAWHCYRYCPGSFSAEALRAAYACAEAVEREREPCWISAYLDHQHDTTKRNQS